MAKSMSLGVVWLPDAIKYFAVWIDPEHDVVRGCVVNEGALGMDEKHVRDPDLLY